jgi:hypothetical protein
MRVLLSFASVVLVYLYTILPASASASDEEVVTDALLPRAIPTTLPTEIPYTGRQTPAPGASKPPGLMVDHSSPTPPVLEKETGWVHAAGESPTGYVEKDGRTLTMTGDTYSNAGLAFDTGTGVLPVKTRSREAGVVTDAASKENEHGHKDGDLEDVQNDDGKGDVIGIAVGAVVAGLATGSLVLWWFIWWRRHRRDKKKRECAVWGGERLPGVGEKGKVV